LPNPLPPGSNKTFCWRITLTDGGNVGMTYVSDYHYTVAISIKTESLVEIWVSDPEMYNGVTLEVAEDIEIDGQKLSASLYGHAKFIYHNDGTITCPKT